MKALLPETLNARLGEITRAPVLNFEGDGLKDQEGRRKVKRWCWLQEFREDSPAPVLGSFGSVLSLFDRLCQEWNDFSISYLHEEAVRTPPPRRNAVEKWESRWDISRKDRQGREQWRLFQGTVTTTATLPLQHLHRFPKDNGRKLAQHWSRRPGATPSHTPLSK